MPRPPRPPALSVVEGGAGGRPGADRPIVLLRLGRRAEAIAEAEHHLVQSDRALWQRGNRVVRVARQQTQIMTTLDGPKEIDLARTVPIGPETMRLRFSQACDLRKFDRRTREAVTVDCPRDFAAGYLELEGQWRLPPLHSVVTAPTLRPDGTVLDRPGYDDKSGIYYIDCGVSFGAVARDPTKPQALQALDLLREAIGGFDLVDETSRAAALSLLITPLILPLLPAAPLHAVTAPVAGSGKSKLIETAAIIATGHPPPVMTLGERREEMEKRIGSALIAGFPMVCLDNIEGALGNPILYQAITQPWVVTRVLGTMDMAGKYGIVLFTATGNNMALWGDMPRRTLMIRLDPRCERPELREFEREDPCIFAARERPALVRAALTIVRAHIVAGRPRARGPLGSFEAWSSHVRDALEWLGCADIVGATGEARRDDKVLAATRAVIARWRIEVGERRVPARELAELAEREGVDGITYPDFRNALMMVAGEGGRVSAQRLGRWLSKAKGRIVDGYSIEDAGVIDGIQRWQVVNSGAAPVD